MSGIAMASLLGGMGGGGREYVLKIIADVKDAVQGVETVSKETQSMKDRMIGVGKSVAAGLAVGAVVEFGRQSITSAAEADDAMDQVEKAFGGASDEILAFSQNTAETMGLSAQDFQAMASETGALLTGMGVGADEAAKQTETLAQRAADMAAIWGTDATTAMDAMNKGMLGNTRGLREFGVVIDKNEIQARAMAKGYVDAEGKVTQAGEAIAAQELILEKTSEMQGAFAENSGDLGSQQQILAAKMENLKTTIGTALLPVLTQLMELMQPLLDFVQQNITWLAPLAGAIAGIVLAVKAWNTVQLILNSSLLANPIFQVVAAVAAITAAVIWAYNNVEWFRDLVDGAADVIVGAFNWIKETALTVFNWIKDHWPLLLAILTGPFGAIVAIVIKNWDTIKESVTNVINWVKDRFGELAGKVSGALGGLVAILKYPFETAWNWIKQIPGWIEDKFRGLWNGINSAMKGLADVIKYPFEIAFKAIKTLWNNTVGGFGFTVPSWVPGVGGKGFRIPEMAAGGIVTRPMIALLGETGPEAVIPLSGSNGFATTVAPVTINVYAMTPNAEVGRTVYNALREYERTTGKGIGGR